MKLPDLIIRVSSPYCFTCLPARQVGSEIPPKQKRVFCEGG